MHCSPCPTQLRSYPTQVLLPGPAASPLLQLLHHGAFMVLLHAAARIIFSCVDHALAVGQLLEATLAGINTPARWVWAQP